MVTNQTLDNMLSYHPSLLNEVGPILISEEDFVYGSIERLNCSG